MSISEEQRQRWNAAVEAVQSDPSPENLAARDAIARECLDSIHRPIVAEYMARQWEAG